ncbi:MAG: 4'-phosphopantetheinyl transferase family protein, partial [Muricoprocola sp.]
MKTRIYTADISIFDDTSFYEKAWSEVTEKRREKAASIRNEKDRKLSVGVEWLLLDSLQKMGIDKKKITFCYGSNGKPYIEGKEKLYFNLSHSGEKMMCAVSDREIGCDIEKIKDCRMRVAEHFFCESEYEWIQKQKTEEEKREMFFRFWTLKESFMKATGLGMRLPLKNFEIQIREDGVSV